MAEDAHKRAIEELLGDLARMIGHEATLEYVRRVVEADAGRARGGRAVSGDEDLARTLLESDAVGHEQMAEVTQDSGGPLGMVEAHRRAAGLIRAALGERS
jgi:hypothetical protein